MLHKLGRPLERRGANTEPRGIEAACLLALRVSRAAE
jgi:hypothetical protein